MDLERSGGLVSVWWTDRFVMMGTDDEMVEVPPDVTMTEDQANALVIEWLRGPMGYPGPQGPQGLAAEPLPSAP